MNLKPDDWFVHAQVPMVRADADGAVRAVNPAFSVIFGMPGEAVAGRSLRELFRSRTEVIPGKEGEEPPWKAGFDGLFAAKGKEAVPVRVERLPLGERGEGGEVVLFLHPSETKASLGDDLHMARLASLGKLLAGIIHEISNPLAVIHGCAQLLKAKSLPPDVAADMDRILSESKRTVDLVKRVLSFSRKNKEAAERITVQTVIEETAVLKRYSLKNNNIRLEYAPLHGKPLTVHGFKNQLMQVFLNLINNSEQALIEGGGLGTIGVLVNKDGDRAVITVSDDGPGIAPADRDEIFTAFFTTKTGDRGTGMGLYISRNIVRRHGGDLRLVEGAEGHTAFQVTLPLWKEGEAGNRATRAGGGS